MMMRKTIPRLVCGLVLAAAVMTAGASTASATPTGVPTGATTAATSVRGVVNGDKEIWGRIDTFGEGFKGFTWQQGEGLIATCKRWGADSRWWYWVRFDIDGMVGHVPGDETNITHSHLDRCS
jgi:hypothetical protein